MKTSKRFTGLCTAIVAVAAMVTASNSANASLPYTVTAIAPPVGYDYSNAAAINDRGEVVGYSAVLGDDFSRRPYIWSPTAGTQSLASQVDPGYLSYASGINNASQVVGFNGNAYVWSSNGGLNALPSSVSGPGSSLLSSNAYAINNAGEIVGWSTSPATGTPHATLWTPDGAIKDLGALSAANNGQRSEAYGINDAGLIVGATSTPTSSSHAFVWDSTKGMVDIGTLFGPGDSSALGVNDRGQVVGWSNQLGVMKQHAFVWSASTGMVDLGTFAGGDSTEQMSANDINNRGQVVGSSSWNGGGSTGFIWTKADGLRRLDDLLDDTSKQEGWHIISASSINDAGEIAAMAQSGTKTWAVMLSTVPEPSTYASMLVGLALLGFGVRRARAQVN